jgi:hypothetical protein
MGSLFVVSDVHGYRDDLARVLGSAGLVDEAGRWTGAEDELWVLGDLTDRGPDGIGTVDLMMSLQQQAPDQVHVLLGNHEALALGMRRFPESRFAHSWQINGGRRTDQEGLTPAHVEWLSGLPALALVRDFLLVHSDTDEYLGWGDSVEGINATVRELLASDDVADAWEVWARLTSRYRFAGRKGAGVAKTMLDRLGGEVIVHGHSIIGTLLDVPSEQVSDPILYADGLVLAIDGGRYDGGPLIVVRLD